jgi:hypothetical protein
MTYPATQTYWLEPTAHVAIGLRRYRSANGNGWTCEDGYHSALVFTGEAEAVYEADREDDRGRLLAGPSQTLHDDPRWPDACRCGYRFTDGDHWQDWQELIYQRSDTGDAVTLRSRQPGDNGGPDPAPPGAMWDAWWMPWNWAGPDGIALMVRCPNGKDWHVDGQASNCTMPQDHVHKCWVRHGDPRECRVTVDKNGVTCAAGAGSIQAGDYHGFLQHGVLTAG